MCILLMVLFFASCTWSPRNILLCKQNDSVPFDFYFITMFMVESLNYGLINIGTRKVLT